MKLTQEIAINLNLTLPEILMEKYPNFYLSSLLA